MSHVHKKLHDLESKLIQIIGLMAALQETMPDGNAHSCVANELELRLKEFHDTFQEAWEELCE